MANTEHLYIERTFTVLKNDSDTTQDEFVNGMTPLKDEHAIAVLGEPGAGKSKSFKEECQRTKDGVYITARDFITFHPKTEWSECTLYIDGLDEIRASSGNGINALDAIRSKLEQLGCPKFRISCRAADWYGELDRESLKVVSGNKNIKVLLINPLTESDQLKFISNKIGTEHAQGFVEKSKRLGLNEWLTNPQTLNMLLDAVGKDGDNWPTTRQETFDLAIRKIITEQNKLHRKAKPSENLSIDSLINSAGLICATLLLADIAYVAVDEDAIRGGELCINDICKSDSDNALFMSVIRSRLFVQIREEIFAPVHRSVSEYLAAKYIAGQINNAGLPLQRVLSLMLGVKGTVVTGLRGLYAWLAVFVGTSRHQLIERDPLGLILYGDVQSYPVAEKELLLLALKSYADKATWLNYHYSDNHKFASLVTVEMTAVINNILSKKNPDKSWQSVMLAVVDGLRHSNSSELHLENLFRILRDKKYIPVLRKYVLYTITKVKSEPVFVQLKNLLNDIHTGKVNDDDDELIGELLTALFPRSVKEDEIFDYLHVPKKNHLIGSYHMFWSYKLCKNPKTKVDILLDEWLKRKIDIVPLDQSINFNTVITKLVSLGIERFGNQITIAKLYSWLSLRRRADALNYSLEKDDTSLIKNWFLSNIHKYFELITFAVENMNDGKKNVRSHLSKVRECLLEVPEPDGFREWCLTNSISSSTSIQAEAYFELAITSFSRLSRESPFDLESFNTLADWVDQNPKFADLFYQYTFSPVEEWRQQS